jgi:hypothetical protein
MVLCPHERRSLIAKRTERQSPGTALSQQTGNSTHHVQPMSTLPPDRTGTSRTLLDVSTDAMLLAAPG